MKRLLRSIAALGLAAVPLAWPAHEAAAAEPFLTPIVVDDAGKVLGPLIMPDSSPADYPFDYVGSVAAQLDPSGPPVGVSASSEFGIVYDYNPDPVYSGYPESGCTGPLYISLGVPSRAVPYPNLPKFIYPDPAAKPIFVRKLRRFSGHCRDYPVSYVGVPAKSVNVDTLGFTKHFSLKLVEGTAAGRPYAVDSQGHVIGPLFGQLATSGSVTRKANTLLTEPSNYSQVVLRLKPIGAIVSLALTGEGFRKPLIKEYFGVEYTTTDCTGKSYIDSFQNTFVPHAFIYDRFPNDIFYREAEIVKVHYRSYWDGRCVTDDQGTRQAYPLRFVPIAAQGFTPPFSVVLH